MSQVPHRQQDIRRALDVLEAADGSQIERELRAVDARGRTVLVKLRKIDDSLAALDLEDALAGLPRTVDPATARAAQATENVWREVADEFGLLKSGEVSTLLGASAANRGFAATRRRRGELLGVERNSVFLFPGFQFDRPAGVVRPWVAPLLALASVHDQSPADVLFWMMSPTTLFDGDRPADHADDADGLVDAARRAWSVEW